MAAIFDAYRLFLNDKRLIPAVEKIIQVEKINAEWALTKVINSLQKEFRKIDDTYLRARFDDVRQIYERIMNNLQNRSKLNLSLVNKPVILLCHDISPTDAMHFSSDKILGIACELGGEISHTSIVARAMSIPAVVGLKGITTKISENSEVNFGWGYRRGNSQS